MREAAFRATRNSLSWKRRTARISATMRPTSGPNPWQEFTFSIDDGMKSRFETVAEHLGLDRDQLFQEALLEKIEELEDYRVVRERLDRPHVRIDDDQVWRELDLED